jgi:hypothetical protein
MIQGRRKSHDMFLYNKDDLTEIHSLLLLLASSKHAGSLD